MNQEHNVIGVIIATDFDRCGNRLMLRGMLPFFGHPIIELIFNELNLSYINQVYVYTIKKGIIIKDLLGKKVKYLLKSKKYISEGSYLSNVVNQLLETNAHILVIDPKYPLLDNEIINELIDFHFDESHDLTIIQSEYQNMLFVPNIFVVNVQILVQIFNNYQNIKQLDSTKIFECVKAMNKVVGVMKTDKTYKILPINNYHTILNIETIFLKRK